MTLFSDAIHTKSSIKQVILLIVIAILIRVVLFFIFDYSQDLNSGDSSYYLETGRNILVYGTHGQNEVATYFRPPFYSVFAGVVASISETALFFYLVQSTLFICFSTIIYFFLVPAIGNKFAFVSALIISASPFDALLNGRVLSENLVTPLIILATFTFIYNKNSKARFFVSGLLLGLTALCRDIYFLLPFFFLVGGLFTKTNFRHLAIFILGFLLIVSPWMYRNSQLPSAGVFLSKGIFWPNLWVGTWMKDNKVIGRLSSSYLPEEASKTYENGNSPKIVLDEWNRRYTSDQLFFKNTVIQYVRNYPLETIQTMFSRHHQLWFGTRSDLVTAFPSKGSFFWYLIKGLLYLFNALLIILALPGMIMAFRKKELPVMLCLPVLYTAVIYFPFYNGETRYSQPVMPILTIFSVYFLLNLLEKIQSHSKFTHQR
jgi:hypothetical protein